MRNLKLTVQYDGSRYHGFQYQKDLPTVQGVLEEVFCALTGETVKVSGASRTDMGVHARGQVINFRTEWGIPLDKVPLAANSGGLPPDIVVTNAEEVPLDFHAQFWAKAKTYRYTLYNARVPSAFHHRYAYFVPQRLRLDAMAEALQYLVGTQDFAAFKAAGSTVRSNVRTVFEAALEHEGPLVVIKLRGNGFLYNMVRIIAGTVLKIGKGRIKPEDLPAIIASKDRTKAGPTAPPHGLCLEYIEY